ncbi:MAG TPA: hypothetical protein VI316_13335, partial [Candidatus Dormibacteraeota bacterium]
MALGMVLEHGRAAGDASTVCWALLVLQGIGTIHRHGLEDDAPEIACARLDEAAALAAAAGLDGHLVAVHYYRGVTAYKGGDTTAMRRHFDACLELLRTLPDTAAPIPSLDTITALTAVVGRHLGPATLRRSDAAVTRVDFELTPRAAEALVRANTAVPRILGAGRRPACAADVAFARVELHEALRLAESTDDDRTI